MLELLKDNSVIIAIGVFIAFMVVMVYLAWKETRR